MDDKQKQEFLTSGVEHQVDAAKIETLEDVKLVLQLIGPNVTPCVVANGKGLSKEAMLELKEKDILVPAK